MTPSEITRFWRITAARLPTEADGEWKPAQIVPHEGDIGCLERGGGPGSAHRDPDGGVRERRSIVHAVADHRDTTLSAQLFDGGDLVLRHQTRAHIVEPNRAADRGGDAGVVAGQHDDASHTGRT